MTLSKTQKLAAHIYRLLKVTELSIPIGRTNKGELSFRFRKDQDDYEVVLDAVPLSMSDTDHAELKGLLEKYLFDKDPLDVPPVSFNTSPTTETPKEPEQAAPTVEPTPPPVIEPAPETPKEPTPEINNLPQ